MTTKIDEPRRIDDVVAWEGPQVYTRDDVTLNNNEEVEIGTPLVIDFADMTAGEASDDNANAVSLGAGDTTGSAEEAVIPALTNMAIVRGEELTSHGSSEHEDVVKGLRESGIKVRESHGDTLSDQQDA